MDLLIKIIINIAMERPYFQICAERKTIFYTQTYDEETHEFKDFEEAKKAYQEMVLRDVPFRYIYLKYLFLDKDGDEAIRHLSYVSWDIDCMHHYGLLHPQAYVDFMRIHKK